ncbi:MAG: hypothetical protein WCJ04_07910, partial [Actinomycetes bacterium]
EFPLPPRPRRRLRLRAAEVPSPGSLTLEGEEAAGVGGAEDLGAGMESPICGLRGARSGALAAEAPAASGEADG